MGGARDTLSLFDPAPPRWDSGWMPRPINALTARGWIERWHYIGKANSSSISWGVFAPDLIAVVQVGMTSNEHGLATRYTLTAWKGNAEITRVVVHPEAPKNTASRAIAAVCSRIHVEEKREWLFSYADTGAGHHGGIYQALNAIYLGVTSDRHGWLLDGKPTHPRTIVAMFGTRARDRVPAIAAGQGHQLEYVEDLLKPKHTYVLPIGGPSSRRAIRKHLVALGVVLPYPKRGDDVELIRSSTNRGGTVPEVAVSPPTGVAELVDAPDSSSGGLTIHEGSTPSPGTAASMVTVIGGTPEIEGGFADPSPTMGAASSSIDGIASESRHGKDSFLRTAAPSIEPADEVSSGETPGFHSGGVGSIPAVRSNPPVNESRQDGVAVGSESRPTPVDYYLTAELVRLRRVIRIVANQLDDCADAIGPAPQLAEDTLRALRRQMVNSLP